MGRPAAYDFETVDDVRWLSVGIRNGAVQIGRQLDENEAVLDDLRQRMVWIVALVTAAAAAVGWLIALSVTGPLVRLTRAATDVERSGRLDVDVPVDRSRRRGRPARHGVQRDAPGAGRVARRPAPPGRGRRPRAAHAADERAHEPRRAAPAPRPRRRDAGQGARRPARRDGGAGRPRRGGGRRRPRWRRRRRRPSASPSPRSCGASPHAPSGGAAGRCRSTADDSVVVAPPPALERAISNLVDNAAKFDPSGQPVEVTVVDGVVTVLDRGPGIGPADRARVFDRFYRADGARSLPGSGLGLSIVKAVAERNGGRVEVADRPGGGAAVVPAAPAGSH